MTNGPDVVHAKVDTQAECDLAATLEIRSISTVMAFRDGVLVYSQAGALPPAALEDLITRREGAGHRRSPRQDRRTESRGARIAETRSAREGNRMDVVQRSHPIIMGRREFQQVCFAPRTSAPG